MTLHIIGIDKDPDLAQHANPSDQFWTSAGDILIDIVNDQPTIGQAVHSVIAAGGDVEITAQL